MGLECWKLWGQNWAAGRPWWGRHKTRQKGYGLLEEIRESGKTAGEEGQRRPETRPRTHMPHRKTQ